MGYAGAMDRSVPKHVLKWTVLVSVVAKHWKINVEYVVAMEHFVAPEPMSALQTARLMMGLPTEIVRLVVLTQQVVQKLVNAKILTLVPRQGVKIQMEKNIQPVESVVHQKNVLLILNVIVVTDVTSKGGLIAVEHVVGPPGLIDVEFVAEIVFLAWVVLIHLHATTKKLLLLMMIHAKCLNHHSIVTVAVLCLWIVTVNAVGRAKAIYAVYAMAMGRLAPAPNVQATYYQTVKVPVVDRKWLMYVVYVMEMELHAMASVIGTMHVDYVMAMVVHVFALLQMDARPAIKRLIALMYAAVPKKRMCAVFAVETGHLVKDAWIHKLAIIVNRALLMIIAFFQNLEKIVTVNVLILAAMASAVESCVSILAAFAVVMDLCVVLVELIRARQIVSHKKVKCMETAMHAAVHPVGVLILAVIVKP